MTHHLGYAKHDYQGKADKETLDDFINHEPDNELLEDELSSAEEENNQSANDETTTLAGKPARKKAMPVTAPLKTVRTDFGKIELEIPRDRQGDFNQALSRNTNAP
jgi:transposase-like protein